jgi:hypothetical protein
VEAMFGPNYPAAVVWEPAGDGQFLLLRQTGGPSPDLRQPSDCRLLALSIGLEVGRHRRTLVLPTPQLHRWVLWPLHLRCHKSTTNRACTLHSILRMFKAGFFRRRHSYRDAPANTVLSRSSPIDEMLDRLNTVRLFLPRAFSLEISLPFAKAPIKFGDEIPSSSCGRSRREILRREPVLAGKNGHAGVRKRLPAMVFTEKFADPPAPPETEPPPEQGTPSLPAGK